LTEESLYVDVLDDEPQEPEVEKEVEIGSVVQLRSGGPYMSVKEIKEEDSHTLLKCVYWNAGQSCYKNITVRRDNCILWWTEDNDSLETLISLIRK